MFHEFLQAQGEARLKSSACSAGNLRPAKFFNFHVNFKPSKVEEQCLNLHFLSGYKRETGSSLRTDTHACSENDRRVSEKDQIFKLSLLRYRSLHFHYLLILAKHKSTFKK